MHSAAVHFVLLRLEQSATTLLCSLSTAPSPSFFAVHNLSLPLATAFKCGHYSFISSAVSSFTCCSHTRVQLPTTHTHIPLVICMCVHLPLIACVTLRSCFACGFQSLQLLRLLLLLLLLLMFLK